ncbi:hypothetical protein N7540_000042 [Penicillium herquei]|nr:hypothetical protein N7540_000042 [Penicillium herquei]
MFYQPGITDHGLPHDPFKACVVPRPIGWISTMNKEGQPNLAPYSQFSNLTFDPPRVMFSANQTVQENRKDTVVNAEQTGKFVWNLATWDLREAVNISAEQVPYGVDEFERAGLAKELGTVTGIPMVRDSPVKLECEWETTLKIRGNPPMGSVDLVIGRVVGIHIKDEVLTNGLIDVGKTKPIARCGYYQYAVLEKTFDMVIPGMSEDVLYGLEGSSRKNREADARGKADAQGKDPAP